MADNPQTQIHSHTYPDFPSNPSPTDDKADYDDLFDGYATDFNKNQTHQTFSPTLAHPSTPQHRRIPSFPANNQSQSSFSHKPLWDYPPSSSEPTAEKERSRPFWQKVLSILQTIHDFSNLTPFQIFPDSLYCRLYVLTVVIQTAIDLAIEGELLVRFHQAGPGLGDQTLAGKMSSMNVYLGIFVLAQCVNFPLVKLIESQPTPLQRFPTGHGFGCCLQPEYPTSFLPHVSACALRHPRPSQRYPFQSFQPIIHAVLHHSNR